ncbi:hypothetical protein AB6E89_08540 [Vibrio breoganii]
MGKVNATAKENPNSKLNSQIADEQRFEDELEFDCMLRALIHSCPNATAR